MSQLERTAPRPDSDGYTIIHLQNVNNTLRRALLDLVLDCADYEPWQRPCWAYDNARAALEQK